MPLANLLKWPSSVAIGLLGLTESSLALESSLGMETMVSGSALGLSQLLSILGTVSGEGEGERDRERGCGEVARRFQRGGMARGVTAGREECW